MNLRHWLAPALASLGLAGLVATFAVEMGAFRRAVEEWAVRDLAARAELAAANLREPLRTGDFRQLYAFGASCENEGLQLTVYSAGGGVFYDSHAQGAERPERVYRSAPSGEFTIRLGLPVARVLAPFRRARLGFVLAALAGGAGMLFVFFLTYRQHVRIRELARLERFRREFVADVSHELKTPLTGILGAVDLLSSQSSQSAQPLLSLLAREAKRLDALAQGILDLARLERADEAVQKIPTDLTDLLCDVVDAMRPQADAKGVAIVFHEPQATNDNRKPPFSCDPQLVARAVTNLVGNAIRHADSPDVIISFETSARGARIVVEDHGKGIPPEEMSRVFERFHRIDPARAAETGGAGLGLAIVRRIARLHGGDVTLTAASPTGCRFELWLPS